VKKKLIRGTIAGSGAFLFAFIFHFLGLLESWELKSWDWRLHLFSNPNNASKNIVLFLVDQESLDIYEKQQGISWPWPRQIYSAVIEYCMRGGVKAIVFDLIFSEPSVWGVEDDRNFKEAMKRARNVFLPIFLHQKEKEEDSSHLALLEKFSLQRKNSSGKNFSIMESATLPLDLFLDSVQGTGNVNLPPDQDGTYRRLPLFFSYKGLLLPSLAFAVASFIKEDLNIEEIPVDGLGRMILRFHGPTCTYECYSLASVINSFALLEEGKPAQIPPEEFKDKIVIIGASAPGLYDLRTSPFSSVYPGAEIHATAIDNLLKGDYIRYSPPVLFIVISLALSLLVGIGVSMMRRISKIIFLGLFSLSLPAVFSSLALLIGYWLEFIHPALAVLLSFMVTSMLNYSIEGKQRRFIKNAFRYYLSPQVIERIMNDPSLLRLGGEKREISSFFSDVAGFTSISEKLFPEELVNLLNDYLSQMTDIILSLEGTLDKYEGDAIIAFWNAPLDQADHALRACRAALKCQDILSELRPHYEKKYGQKIFMRIGINSGEAVVGNMGSKSRFDYTAMGDTVNLASRLEGACKQYGVSILVGENTFERVKDEIICREVDLIRVVGKEKPVRIFELIGERNKVQASELERIEVFHRALFHFRKRDWEKAIELLSKIEDDPLSRIYITRCERLKNAREDREWDGVWDLKEK